MFNNFYYLLLYMSEMLWLFYHTRPLFLGKFCLLVISEADAIRMEAHNFTAARRGQRHSSGSARVFPTEGHTCFHGNSIVFP